jgi:hypothetical protein
MMSHRFILHIIDSFTKVIKLTSVQGIHFPRVPLKLQEVSASEQQIHRPFASEALALEPRHSLSDDIVPLLNCHVFIRGGS